MTEATGHGDEVQRWHEGIAARAAGHKHPVKRGLRPARRTAPGAWHCEGRWQHDEQMDIWQCIDEAELDRRRAAGLDEDPDDETTETDEQD